MTTLSRPSAAESAPFHKLAEPGAVGDDLSCGPDEVAVVVAMGRVLGTLGPGRHALTAAESPFMGMAAGPVELVFVSQRISGLRFGGKLGAQQDQRTGVAWEPSAFGAATLRVADAARFVGQLGEGEPDGVSGYLKPLLLKVLSQTIASAGLAPMELLSGQSNDALLAAVQKAPEFAELGLTVEGFDSLSFSVSEETLAALQKAASAPKAAAQAGSRCGHCGGDVPAGAKSCPNCSSPTGSSCAKCGRPQAAGARFCIACGTRF